MSKVIVSSEPNASKISSIQEDYQLKLIAALNWYTTEKDKKDARKYLEDYCKKFLSNICLSGVPDGEIILTMGWVARLQLRGAILPEVHTSRLNDYLFSLKPVKKQHTPSAPKISIQEAMQNRITSYLGELEGIYDDLAKDPKVQFSLLDDLKKNQLPQVVGEEIETWSKKKLNELIIAYEGKDKDIAEGYSNFKRKNLLAFIKKLATFIEDAEKYSAFKRANRKPRQKKIKPPSVQVRGLKYKQRDDDLKVESITPSEIVGAMQLWVFNVKTRKLAVYRTESSSGIQVKGTSLQNYEPEMSEQKTIRKPEAVIQDLLKAGKVQLRKFLDNIKSVSSVPSGRINADTLILRALK